MYTRSLSKELLAGKPAKTKPKKTRRERMEKTLTLVIAVIVAMVLLLGIKNGTNMQAIAQDSIRKSQIISGSYVDYREILKK